MPNWSEGLTFLYSLLQTAVHTVAEMRHPRVAIKELKKIQPDDERFEEDVRAEVYALDMIRRLDHPHLIKAIAYFRRGPKHYFMFPWAKEGNLRDYWQNALPTQDKPWFKWVFGQLTGIALAIKVLHHNGNGQSCRHGDLKPENILCFSNPDSSHDVTLVIADVGLARVHPEATQLRNLPTRTITGTWMYGPPEAEINKGRPRSRRYDIWSMGCIYLEFIIWILYGIDALTRFRNSLERFYVIENDPVRQRRTARVHDEAQRWIDHIRTDPCCPPDTALRRLLELIAKKLLVVKIDLDHNSTHTTSSPEQQFAEVVASHTVVVPTIQVTTDAPDPQPEGDSDDAPTRATAETMYADLEEIYGDATMESSTLQWKNWEAKSRMPPMGTTGHLQPQPSSSAQPGGLGTASGSMVSPHV